jgi:hypothetical protein
LDQSVALGSIYIADAAANRVWRVDADGLLRAFAGNGARGSNGDGGLATAAELSAPTATWSLKKSVRFSERAFAGCSMSSAARRSADARLTLREFCALPFLLLRTTPR